MDFTQNFFKRLLLKQTQHKKSFFTAREYYWDCITSYGDKYYESGIKSNEYFDKQSDEPDDPFAVFNLINESDKESICKNCDAKLMKTGICQYCDYVDPKLGFQESQQMSQSNVYGFNRTFIGPYSDLTTKSGNKLSELQKWITIDPQEMELKKVGETINESLNAMKYYEPDNIFRTAINMYWNIMEYYKTNQLKLNLNKGNLKKGYILLCIYYSLVLYKQNISKERLIRSIPDSRMSFLPEANENILRIFENVQGYEFLYVEQEAPYIINLCNLIDILPREVVREINRVKADMVKSGLFQKKMTSVQIAACIYYVCNILNKPRLKIILPATGEEVKITQLFLSSKCGGFSSPTLTKQVDIITNFYG